MLSCISTIGHQQPRHHKENPSGADNFLKFILIVRNDSTEGYTGVAYSQVERFNPNWKIIDQQAFSLRLNTIGNRLVATQIKTYLCHQEHGFLPRWSVETNLLTLIDSISEYLDKGIHVDKLYFEFKKAFDRVVFWPNFSIFMPRQTALCATRNFKIRKLYTFVLESARVRLWLVTYKRYDKGPSHAPKFALHVDDPQLIYALQQFSDCKSLQEDINRSGALMTGVFSTLKSVPS